jgi:hypothetical protein
MESQKRTKRTLAELEKRGEQIERNPLAESVFYQISFIQHWQPDHRPN